MITQCAEGLESVDELKNKLFTLTKQFAHYAPKVLRNDNVVATKLNVASGEEGRKIRPQKVLYDSRKSTRAT